MLRTGKLALSVMSVTCITLSAAMVQIKAADAAIVWDYSPKTTGAVVSPSVGNWFTNMSTKQNFAEQFLLPQSTTLTGMDVYTISSRAAVEKSVTVRLWEDYEGAPKTLLKDFTETLAIVDVEGASTDPNPTMVRAFARFNEPIRLLANMRYWIGMSGTGDGESDLGQLALVNLNAPGDSRMAQFSDKMFTGLTNNEVGDQAFRLHGNISEVPTPAMIPGLLSFGMAIWRKSKRR
jgi:hypothetical protein